jgi:hypothetical protein
MVVPLIEWAREEYGFATWFLSTEAVKAGEIYGRKTVQNGCNCMTQMKV